MGLLKPAKNETAFAKLGIMGEAGSGKTYTASTLARGLAKQAKSKQIAFFDTEKGSDFEVPRMEKEGFELVRHKGRAFSDLITIMKEVEKEKIPVLIIDSITHVWRDLCDSYQKKYNKKFLTMYDWGTLKTQWKEYTDLFINSQMHILMCGRLGFTYDQSTNEDTGKKELVKTGTRMKVEGETGYEPDLLLEMESIGINDKIVNRAWVIKDRSDTMNGKYFDAPNFNTFKTFFAALNIGGEHKGIDTQRNSEERFADPDWSAAEVQKRKEIFLDELKACLIKADMDGTSAESKKKRVTLLEKHFGTSSGTAIESLNPKQLEPIIAEIKKELFPHKPLEGAPQSS
ncbi:MAG TPA: AAA family ATPase [Nitrosomonas sp.]|nr:AAA family ATPase [Nitrosomonas sp.]